MVIRNYIKILNQPELIENKNSFELKAILKEYPYFQSARALYLKTLKNQESFKYNNQLKITAAYTNDRTILFDFITSKSFNATPPKRNIPKPTIHEIYSSVNSIEEAKEALNIGKPISFVKNETYSFNQWLQLGSKKPIVRTEPVVQSKKESIKDAIIDNFIANNPKISRVQKNASPQTKTVEKTVKHPQLMTETLAKVYLEQKKFDNAIKAYEILSLKYPEKSGFFADQIKRIQIIQNNK